MVNYSGDSLANGHVVKENYQNVESTNEKKEGLNAFWKPIGDTLYDSKNLDNPLQYNLPEYSNQYSSKALSNPPIERRQYANDYNVNYQNDAFFKQNINANLTTDEFSTPVYGELRLGQMDFSGNLFRNAETLFDRNEQFFEQDPNLQKEIKDQKYPHTSKKPNSRKQVSKPEMSKSPKKRPSTQGSKRGTLKKRASTSQHSNSYNHLRSIEKDWHAVDPGFFDQISEMDAIIKEARLNLFGAYTEESGKMIPVNNIKRRPSAVRRRSNPFPNATKRYVFVQGKKNVVNKLEAGHEIHKDKSDSLHHQSKDTPASRKRHSKSSLDPYLVEPFKLQEFPPVQISTVGPKSKKLSSDVAIYYDEEKNKHILTRRPSTAEASKGRLSSKNRDISINTNNQTQSDSIQEDIKNANAGSSLSNDELVSQFLHEGESLRRDSVQNHTLLFGSPVKSRSPTPARVNPMRSDLSTLSSTSSIIRTGLDTTFSTNTLEEDSRIPHPDSQDTPKSNLMKKRRNRILAQASIDRLSSPKRVVERPSTAKPNSLQRTITKKEKQYDSRITKSMGKQAMPKENLPSKSVSKKIKQKVQVDSNLEKESKSREKSSNLKKLQDTSPETRDEKGTNVATTRSTEEVSLRAIQETRRKLLKEFLL